MLNNGRPARTTEFGRVALTQLGLLLLATLLGLEAVVRLIGRADHLFTEAAFEMAPGATYWRYRPGFAGWVRGPTYVRIGSLGSRLHGPTDTSSGDLRVVIFGDSVTFGQAVEDGATFSARLEAALRQSRRDIDVLNFGVEGHTVEMQIAHLADRLPLVQPTVVVWAFATDGLDSARAPRRVDRFGYLTGTSFGDGSFGTDLLRSGLGRSRLALLSKDAWLRWRETAPADLTDAISNATVLEPALQRFETAVARFEQLTVPRAGIVLCLDLRQSPLTRAMHAHVRARFPKLPYFDAAPTFDPVPLDALRVLPDGHPNSRAHLVYTRMLARPVLRALASVVPDFADDDPTP